MQSTIEKIKEIVTEAMNKEDIIVCSVSYEKENNYNFLKIVLDKVNGIDLDTIVEATNIINPLLDEYDLISEEYVLDISSKERG
ncbi:ribosome maturation factor RimP [Clostridium sp. CAG:533]|nr:ribosome maturation factor RimP [Clostridium sp. CAG:533]